MNLKEGLEEKIQNLTGQEVSIGEPVVWAPAGGAGSARRLDSYSYEAKDGMLLLECPSYRQLWPISPNWPTGLCHLLTELCCSTYSATQLTACLTPPWPSVALICSQHISQHHWTCCSQQGPKLSVQEIKRCVRKYFLHLPVYLSFPAFFSPLCRSRFPSG